MENATIVTITNLNKSVFIGDGRMAILKHINCTIRVGDFMMLYGPPSSGKSVFLYSLLGIEEPNSGEITIEGKNIFAMTENERASFRRSHIGIVYGHPLWVGSMNVLKNIEFSLHLNGYQGNVDSKAREILEMVDMVPWSHYHPTDLDNLQQQKIALARAIVTDPQLIVADDPTRHLDLLSGHKLMQTFKHLQDYNKTIIMLTGTHSFLKYANRPYYMDKGVIKEEMLFSEKESLPNTLHK